MYLSIPLRAASPSSYRRRGDNDRDLPPGAEILSAKGRPGMTAVSNGFRDGISVSRIGWPVPNSEQLPRRQ